MDLIFNLNHCAEYIKEKVTFTLTTEQIIEILALETEYMIENGYAE